MSNASLSAAKPGIDYPGVSIIFFCHDGQGNFLMGKRSSQARDERGRWDIGGGRLELGQTVVETLQKEIREEYSTQVLDFEFLGYRDVHRNDQGKKGQSSHWIGLDFKVLVDPKLVANGEPHKFEQVEWFTLQTVPKDSHSQFPEFLRLYREKL